MLKSFKIMGTPRVQLQNILKRRKQLHLYPIKQQLKNFMEKQKIYLSSAMITSNLILKKIKQSVQQEIKWNFIEQIRIKEIKRFGQIFTGQKNAKIVHLKKNVFLKEIHIERQASTPK